MRKQQSSISSWIPIKGGPNALARAEEILRREGIPARLKGHDYRVRPQVQVPSRYADRARDALARAGVATAGGPYPLPVAEARARFADMLNRVAYRGERVLMTRHGKPLAALIPAADLQSLQDFEDEDDLRAARRALKEAGRKGTLPLETVLNELRGRR